MSYSNGIYDLEHLNELNGCSDLEGYRYSKIEDYIQSTLTSENIGFFLYRGFTRSWKKQYIFIGKND